MIVAKRQLSGGRSFRPVRISFDPHGRFMYSEGGDLSKANTENSGERMERSLIDEIEFEYRKVDARWLTLHYSASVGLVVCSVIVECLIGLLMHRTGEIHMSGSGYLLKYLCIPAILNMACVLIDTIVLRISRIPLTTRIYIVSLMFVEICFILFTIHGAFSSLFFLFAIPVLLTTIYVNYTLTAVTAAYSVILLVTSELFLRWDPEKPSVFSDGMRLGDFLIALFFLAGFFGICAVIIYFEKLKNDAGMRREIERRALQNKLVTDELTGINNRLGFRNAIRDMEEDFSGTEYIFAMIDLDRFKALNDGFGHLAGDQCLSGFAGILVDVCGKNATFRFGGDEFCLLFRGISMEEALVLCRRVQEKYGEFGLRPPFSRPLSASFGVSCYRSGMSPSQLIENTDQALYASKKKRGSITVFEDISSRVQCLA
jgi:diguanylate cyclase (GGDEF)-like protein